jgi:hypothetical protein
VTTQPHPHGDAAPQGGVDRLSNAGDIRDALARLGVELRVEQTADGSWAAHIGAAHDAAEDKTGPAGAGDTQTAAAFDAWQRYMANQGGGGQS